MSVKGHVWLGVDIGTQSVRVAIVDDGGTVLALASAGLRSEQDDHAGRRHEQDPHQWWAAVGTASREAFSGLARPAAEYSVGAVAVCSTSGTVLLVDHAGTPLTPALMYDDTRAGAELDVIRRAAAYVPGSDRVQVSWALPKIRWLLTHYREAAARPGFVAHSADVVAAALVGERVGTDSSHALKSGYDVVHDTWNTALLDAAGIDRDHLPQVVAPGSVLGVVSIAAAEQTGIPAGTPVVAGMTDGCAAHIAAGSLAPGTWNSVLGTTLVIKGVSENLVDDPAGAVYNHRHPDGGWLPGGASNVGGAAVTQEFGSTDLDRLSEAARTFEPASAVVYPLTARGERFPFVQATAEGFALGRASGPEERYASLLQGVAYVERLCFDRLLTLGADVSGTLSITGGATRSDYWNQLRADVLDRPLVVPASREPVFGMAVLASARHESVTARAAVMVSRRGVVEPRPGAHERFADGYAAFGAELIRRGYVDADFATGLAGAAA